MASKQAAKQFAEQWKNKGDEKQDTQTFWISLLQQVFGVGRDNIQKVITFEVRTSKKKKGKDFKDAVLYRYDRDKEVLIEQKSFGISLGKPIKQSDGEMLTPFEQAKRYDDQSIVTDKARWIITCNFNEFWIYDMTLEGAALYEPVKKVKLADLPNHLGSFAMLSAGGEEPKPNFEEEVAVSVKAGDLVGKMYDAFEKQYSAEDGGKISTEHQQSLNKLCVRLVFCLYAEDSGLFTHGDHQFYDYLDGFKTQHMRRALIGLFETLNTPEEQRDPFLDSDLKAFPYVNGGLFEGKIVIPQFTEEIRHILLDEESARFDWSAISPTIFGAVFESTLNPETRRSGGMHYTSIENIHKVIDPLFLDDLKAECDRLLSNESTTDKQLLEFQNKLASLRFLDPACGSGNFLTETYLSLRRMENRIIGKSVLMQMANVVNPIKVSIQQFYGIEINNFAVSVAQTALWIAEHKMFKETERLLVMDTDFLPLKTFTHIHEGNALQMDWNEVVPADQLTYIMGNPPFLGYGLQTKEQKADVLSLYVDEDGKPYKTAGKIDYVSCWYMMTARFILGTSIHCAFVSTNSITQGEQVSSVWKPLFTRFHIHIDFAYRTFRWDSEASIKAHVHVVIIGFSSDLNSFSSKKMLFDENGDVQQVSLINPYLINAPVVWIDSRSKPLCNVPKMTTGNRPADGGHLIIEAQDYDQFIKDEPDAIPYIKRLTGSDEWINNKKRYCLWLVGVDPQTMVKMPEVMARVNACREDRLNGAPDRQKLAATPWLFRETNNPDSYIIVPRVSSEKRKYIPLGFADSSLIPTDSATIIPNAGLYEFGVLESLVHMAWMRTVAGRLEMRYRYSKDIVYNNFPWPFVSETQKHLIEKTAQGILDARNTYAGTSLADMYGTYMYMYPELVKAHEANDKAVMDAYGFDQSMTEPEIVAELMKMYQRLIEEEENRIN